MNTSRPVRFFACILAGTLMLAAAAAFAQPSLVSYQGQLSVNGTPFTGNASFKFAVMCGTTSPWSNDGTSTNGSQPAVAVTLPVAQGVFNVLLGDPALAMVPLTAALVSGCATPQLRVWVDTGTGFEQLADQPVASSPFALQSSLASGAIGTFKVGNGTSTAISLMGATGEASVGSIRFGDNSVQTTAATGGGGTDSDWLINGANMSSMVTGNVGIGTAAPDRKLHISGGTDIDPAFGGGYLRIGPTTTGNLLIDNNEIQAVNNGAANNLGINVEGGSVGIGTVNPSSRLHVLGSVRADGVGGFDVRNPNNTAAIARLDWNADIARIRVGGTGTGALNGFDFEGISDASWLRILNNGNVGINTVAPTERLMVNGNTVITGNLTVQGTIAGGGGGGGGSVAIPSSAFLEAETNQMDVHRSNVLLNGRTAGQGLTFEAPVYLPDGATITGFEVHVTDSDATVASGRNIQTFLMSHPFTAGAGAIIATLATSGAPGRTVLSTTSLSTVVNNTANHYVVACNWVTPTGGVAVSALAVHGMRVIYTLP
jgi:hypothetical protein